MDTARGIVALGSHGITYTPDEFESMTVGQRDALAVVLEERAKEVAHEQAMAEARAQATSGLSRR